MSPITRGPVGEDSTIQRAWARANSSATRTPQGHGSSRQATAHPLTLAPLDGTSHPPATSDSFGHNGSGSRVGRGISMAPSMPPATGQLHGVGLAAPGHSRAGMSSAVGNPVPFTPEGRTRGTPPAETGLVGAAVSAIGRLAPVIRSWPAVRELDVERLDDRQRASLVVNLPLNTVVAARLNTQRFEASDPFVTNDPLRAATARQMASEGTQPAWVSAEGVLEVGSGVGGTLPFGLLGSAGGGFVGDSVIRYRSLLPQSAGKDLTATAPVLPLAPLLVRGLRPGSELQIAGRGRVTTEASGAVGVGNGWLSAEGGNVTGFEGDVCLHVRMLDQNGRVRVSINRETGFSTDVNASLTIGGAPTKQGTAELGQGLLKSALTGQSSTVLKELTRAVQVHAELGADTQKTSRLIAAYDVDLSNPQGMHAYRELMRLSCATADSLAAKGHDAVKGVYSFREHASASRSRGRLNLFGKEMLAFMVQNSEKGGHLRGPDGRELIYRETQYSKTWNDFIRGKKSIVWQAVSVPAELPELAGSYFNMRFTAHNRRSSHRDVQAFVNLGRMLGADFTCTDGANAAHRATDARADIYFTDEGIRRIDAANAERAQAAYLKVIGRLCPQECAGIDVIADLPAKTRDEAMALARKHRSVATRLLSGLLSFGAEPSQLERRYAQLTGRDLVADSAVLVRAIDFGRHVQRLDTKAGEENLRDFFTTLGKAQGFDYVPCIAALADLAGSEETWVNELVMEGDTVSIRAVSQGHVEHPEKVLRAMWRGQGALHQPAAAAI